MQKKLIALAVAGIMAAPMAAQAASAEVYGKVRLSVDMNDNGDTTVGNEDSAIALTSHSSRLGFKGSEDLDGGLSALYQFEAQVDTDDGADLTSSMRDTFVGLSGDFGTVLLGKLSTPYKSATKKIDPFGDTAADYNAVVKHDTRANNAIAYVAPKMGDVSVAVAYVTNTSAGTEMDDAATMTEAEADKTAISLSVAYSADGLGVSFAHESLGALGGNDAGGNPSDMESTKIGVSYDMDATTFGLVYQMNEDGAVAAVDQDVVYVSVTHKIDGLTLKGAIGQLGETTSGASNGGDMLALGVTKSYSKNVELYALYASMSNDTSGANGLKKVKSSGVAGADVSTLSAGINLKFSSM